MASAISDGNTRRLAIPVTLFEYESRRRNHLTLTKLQKGCCIFDRYNSGQSRFTQVDPIGMASASTGNPQSLNLFAYVGNNPIDFVDPSGLDSKPPWDPDNPICKADPLKCEPPPLGPDIIINVRGNPWDDLPRNDNPWGYLPIEDLGEGEVGGGGVGISETGTSQIKSCQRFADRVEQIAEGVLSEKLLPNASKKADAFFIRLYIEFSEDNGAYSSDGFKRKYQDFDGSPNQARHYIGGFAFGYILGSTLGLIAANLREDNTTKSGKADRALNAVSTRHAGNFFWTSDRIPDEIKTLAKKIRREVCKKQK